MLERNIYKRAGFAAVLAAVFLAPLAAKAEFSYPTSFSEERGPWEFGVDWGVQYATQKNSFTHLIDNQRAYDLLAAESTGDELGEGWVAPPLPGNSTISATMKSEMEIGFHLYYQSRPWLAVGLDTGWGMRRDLHIDNRGVYDSFHFMLLKYRANMIHVTAPVKVGPAIGRWKPYLLVGPGAYLVHERAEISFTDADDPQLKPVGVAVHDRTYLGVNGGAGIEYVVGTRGIIGLEAQYHKVFANPYHLDFLLPKLRLSVAF